MRLLKTLLLVAAVAAFAQAGSAAAQSRSSLPYRTLDPVMPPVSGVLGATPAGKIEVIQFFYFGCPHCFDQQPLIDDWLRNKPADVEFRYLPALREDKWLTLTRAFFALDKIGEAERLRRPIYDVINFDGVALADEDKLIAWVVRNGVDRERFLAAFNADETRAKIEAARKMTADYGVRATPTLVVAGKYAFSSGQAGSHYEAMKLLDQFILQARNERK
jgi:protein dithiol oxidoreductase (disulfide-forming)